MKEIANPLVGVKTTQTESVRPNSSNGNENYKNYGNQRPNYRHSELRGQNRGQPRGQPRNDRYSYNNGHNFHQDGPRFHQEQRYDDINMRLLRLALQGFS